LLKHKNLDVYEKYSRFRKRLIHQDYRLSAKELKTFGSSGLNVIRWFYFHWNGILEMRNYRVLWL